MESFRHAQSNRRCSGLHPILAPQAVFVVASIVALATSACLMNHATNAAAVVTIVIASISIAYRILYQITLRLSCLLNKRSAIALNKVSSWVKRQKLVMVALVVAWAFAFVFEVVIDLSVGKDVWHKHKTRSLEIARLIASALALMAAIGIWLVLEFQSDPTAMPDLEKGDARPRKSLRKTRSPFVRSLSLLSAKPSLSTISDATPSSSSTKSSFDKSPSKFGSYSPFPSSRICDRPDSNIRPHPKLQRVSSDPSLATISAPPTIPMPAHLVSASVQTLKRPTPPPNRTTRPPSQHRASSASSGISMTTTTDHRRKSSSLSEGASTMASVRRARSHRSSNSSSSASTRRSRLRIMETLSEPENGEEDESGEEAIPAVPPLDLSKWREIGRFDSTSVSHQLKPKIYTCRANSTDRNMLSPKVADGVKNRPLPPLPLMVVKKIQVSSIEHPTPPPQRAQSRVSKAASIVRSKSAATARSVVSARVQKPKKLRASACVREAALRDSKSTIESERVVKPVRTLSQRERYAQLGLELEPRDLFRRSTIERLKVVGV